MLELEHPAVWTALQLRHLEAIPPYDPAAPFQWAEEGDTALCYVPRFRKEDVVWFWFAPFKGVVGQTAGFLRGQFSLFP